MIVIYLVCLTKMKVLGGVGVTKAQNQLPDPKIRKLLSSGNIRTKSKIIKLIINTLELHNYKIRF